MATTIPAEIRVRLWRGDGVFLWASKCDPPEVYEEVRQRLALTDGEWVFATIDYGPRCSWRQRWAGRIRLDCGRIEYQSHAEQLAHMLNPTNPLLPVPAPCQHISRSGDEGPVAELGRMPTRWRCPHGYWSKTATEGMAQ